MLDLGPSPSTQECSDLASGRSFQRCKCGPVSVQLSPDQLGIGSSRSENTMTQKVRTTDQVPICLTCNAPGLHVTIMCSIVATSTRQARRKRQANSARLAGERKRRINRSRQKRSTGPRDTLKATPRRRRLPPTRMRLLAAYQHLPLEVENIKNRILHDETWKGACLGNALRQAPCGRPRRAANVM